MEEVITRKIKKEEEEKTMREEMLEAMKKEADAKRAEYMKEMERSGNIDEKRVLLNLMARKPLPKPTPLKGKSLDVIKEAAPWRKGAVI